MSGTKLRRFSIFHIIFHWMIALPYVLLLITGAMIFLRRLGFLARLAPTIESVHRWTGIALAIVLVQVLFASIVTGY